MSDTCEEFVVTDAEAFMSSALLSLSLDAMEEAAVEGGDVASVFEPKCDDVVIGGAQEDGRKAAGEVENGDAAIGEVVGGAAPAIVVSPTASRQ